MEVKYYQFSSTWAEKDQVFVAKVLEFPSLSAHGDSPQEAISELEQVIKFVIEDLQEEGAPIPEPLSKRPFSGKLNVRMAESLHRDLAVEALEENISLNQLINLKLSLPLKKHYSRKKRSKEPQGSSKLIANSR
tara:strand:- start:1000 stop:1401 length:402 start_codon:yes stop_codon:yes gene_type:complete